MCKHDITKNGTRLVLAFVILTLVFVQTFGIAPKENPAFAQSTDQWEYVGQSVADGVCFAPNSPVTVSWTVKNSGSDAWQNYTFVGGPNNVSTNVAYTSAGQSVSLMTTFTTPNAVGDYRVDYKLIDETGNTVNSTKGSTTMWLSYKVSDSCNTNSPVTVPQNGVNSQQPTASGHWEDIPAQTHQECAWQTWFGCWYWKSVVDVPASQRWVPDPVPAPIASTLPAETQPPAPTVQPEVVTTVVYADPTLEMMYQLAVSSNPQMSYTDEQYRQMFFDWYGSNSKTIFAREFELQSNNIAYVKTSEIMALRGGIPGWLYALAAWTVTTTVIAMNAEQAANLRLPTITLSSAPTYVIVPSSYVPNVTFSSAVAKHQAHGLQEAFASVTAMEQLLQINATTTTMTAITLPSNLTLSGDKTITLPRGTVVTISYIESNGYCNHKTEFKVQFPWGPEIFQGFSELCGGWGLLEALTNMLKSWSDRVMRFWNTPGMMQVGAQTLKALIQKVTSDIIDFVLNYLMYLITHS